MWTWRERARRHAPPAVYRPPPNSTQVATPELCWPVVGPPSGPSTPQNGRAHAQACGAGALELFESDLCRLYADSTPRSSLPNGRHAKADAPTPGARRTPCCAAGCGHATVPARAPDGGNNGGGHAEGPAPAPLLPAGTSACLRGSAWERSWLRAMEWFDASTRRGVLRANAVLALALLVGSLVAVAARRRLARMLRARVSLRKSVAWLLRMLLNAPALASRAT